MNHIHYTGILNTSRILLFEQLSKPNKKAKGHADVLPYLLPLPAPYRPYFRNLGVGEHSGQKH